MRKCIFCFILLLTSQTQILPLYLYDEFNMKIIQIEFPLLNSYLVEYTFLYEVELDILKIRGSYFKNETLVPAKNELI